MVSIQGFGLLSICIVAFLSHGNAECPTKSRAKMDVCVATFSTANVFNTNDRKNQINAGNTTCPKEILKDSCTSFNVLMNCVNLAGFPEGCEEEFNKELRNQDFQCTYLELGAICPDAEKIGGAGSIVVSLSLIVASLAAAIFGRL